LHQKLGQSFWRKIGSKKILSKLSRLHDQSFSKVSIPSHHLAVNSKTNNRYWFRKDVLIGQFPSKSVKVFRKIGLVFSPSKSIKVLWQSFLSRFTRSKNFDQVFDGKLWSCKRPFKLPYITFITYLCLSSIDNACSIKLLYKFLL